MEKYYPDKTDLSILRLLQANARISTKELALKVHKSQSSVYDRVKRLERLGFIRSYTALVSLSKLSGLIIAYIQVSLKDHSAAALINFNQQMCELEEVFECAQITGSYDFMLRSVTRDMQAYSRFLYTHLMELPNVASINSSIVIREGKYEPGLLL